MKVQSLMKSMVRLVLVSITFLTLVVVTVLLTKTRPGLQQSSLRIFKSHEAAPLETHAEGKNQKLSAVSKITPQDYKKAAILDQIIMTGNDNDPRLDRDLRKLSEGAKILFQQRYESLPGESLNERGTIVFLLGRNIQSEDDVEFLNEVLAEPPCLSMASCSQAAPPSAKEDAHHEAGTSVTLAYPQLQSLKAFEAYLRKPDKDPTLADAMKRSLENAQQSSIGQVSHMATTILQRLADNG